MTERVTRDAELLAAWPQRGVCWKLVGITPMNRLRPVVRMFYGADYSAWGAWQQARYTDEELGGFHCLTSLQDARSLVDGQYAQAVYVVEFDYHGILGVGQFKPRCLDTPIEVLLCDRIRPRSWVTLPGCAVAQPVEQMAEVPA